MPANPSAPRDPVERVETRTEWRPVCRRTLKDGPGKHEWHPSTEATEEEARAVAKEVRDNFGWDAFAIEKVTITTTITRHPLAGQEEG